MPDIHRIAPTFANLRGTHRILRLIDVGTHCSLVRLRSGRFVLLDSYSLAGEALDLVRSQTDDGAQLEAVIHLHPFHTLHCRRIAELFPQTRQYGTSRHHRVVPEIAWQPQVTESEAFAGLYRDDFDLTVPRGVRFVPDNQHLHFASVLAIHRESGTLHVDDTLSQAPVPFGSPRLVFHPTLRWVLDDAAAFRGWAEQLAERCETVRNVCTAHGALAPLVDQPPGNVAERIRGALASVASVL